MATDFLKILNPWWEDRSAIYGDQHLKAVLDKPYYFDNPIKRDLEFKGGRTFILRGPRQVGKTTLLKEMILKAIDGGTVDARDCLFLTCEGISNQRELADTLMPWLKERKGRPILLCLDEITFVKEWQRAFLLLINSGVLRNTIAFLSGSNARDLKEMGERFPGRGVREVGLYPLSLTDYRSLKCFEALERDEILRIYMRIGGFPHAVRDYCEQRSISDETCETYANWIFGDAYRYGLTREILLHILYRIYDTLASRITYQRLVEKSPVRSHETAAAYVEHLESSFLCKVLTCYDPDKDMGSSRKAKKIYFIDPLLYQVAGGYLQGVRNVSTWWQEILHNEDMRGKIFEAVVVSQLARHNERVYYWYSSNTQREVDALVRNADELSLFEIKTQARATKPVLGREVNMITPETLEF